MLEDFHDMGLYQTLNVKETVKLKPGSCDKNLTELVQKAILYRQALNRIDISLKENSDEGLALVFKRCADGTYSLTTFIKK
jgi:hypothetical protein